jgi:hypothetical protein
MKSESLAVVLLSVILVGVFVLTGIGVLSKSELLPIVGGCVVVAHRLIAVVASGKPARGAPSSVPPSALPPGSGASLLPLVGMLGGMGAGQLLGMAADAVKLASGG